MWDTTFEKVLDFKNVGVDVKWQVSMKIYWIKQLKICASQGVCREFLSGVVYTLKIILLAARLHTVMRRFPIEMNDRQTVRVYLSCLQPSLQHCPVRYFSLVPLFISKLLPKRANVGLHKFLIKPSITQKYVPERHWRHKKNNQ